MRMCVWCVPPGPQGSGIYSCCLERGEKKANTEWLQEVSCRVAQNFMSFEKSHFKKTVMTEKSCFLICELFWRPFRLPFLVVLKWALMIWAGEEGNLVLIGPCPAGLREWLSPPASGCGVWRSRRPRETGTETAAVGREDLDLSASRQDVGAALVLPRSGGSGGNGSVRLFSVPFSY